jgi:hypothetical protein
MKIASLVQFVTFAALPVSADPIDAKDAPAHVGQTATVEGRLGVHRMPSGEVYLDLDGNGDAAPVSGYISKWNAGKFSDVEALDGKKVDMTGAIANFRNRPEVFLSDPSQITAK